MPDNLKSGVVKACLYDPEINRTYAGMAAHYDTAIVPARPRKPRDKAKVEVSVQIVERWVLARLRNRRFFSLAELNQAIHERLEDLNGRETKHLGASRRKLFEALDRPALKPLPAQPYQYAEWKQRRMVVWRRLPDPRMWAATRLPLWKISTVRSVIRAQPRIEPPGEEIVDQGLDDDRVLRRPLDHGQDMLVAVAIDADRRHQDMVADMQTVDLDD